MLGAYASVAVLIAVSIAAGQAILSLCGRRRSSWLAGPVGLAAVLVVSGIAIKLPGHGTAVAIALAVLFALSLASLVKGGRVAGGDPGLAVAAAGLVLILASIPFIVNGRVGSLGVGLVNDDMASHLLIADWLNT
ncbi:MAG: hypothetical protein AABM66_12650, partial [Actinomycetota bacterium]